MIFKILSCRDHLLWNSYLAKIPAADQSPHFMPEYYKLFEDRNEGKGVCFIGEDKGKVVVYPTLINSINELGYELDRAYYDLQGTYGYNGPVANCSDPDFLQEFSNSILHYCKESGIIAEFIRFCPVLRNHEFLNYIQPYHALDNVLFDLTPGIEGLWKDSFDNGVRKAIRKATKTNLSFKAIPGGDVAEADVASFLKIYHETMSRNKAGAYYFFSQSFIMALCAALPRQTLLTFVLLAGEAISTALVLFNTSNAYGFLNGTLSAYYPLNPNSYLYYELLKYLIASGVKAYSIGGGKTRDDSVYLYKKSFSKNIDSKFYIGKYIHNENVYNGIIEQWSRKFPEKVASYKNFLLKYRY